MPLKTMSDDEIKAGMAAMDHELRHLLSENGVSGHASCILAEAGPDVPRFKNLFLNLGEVQSVMDTIFNLKHTEGVAALRDLTAIMSAWEAAKEKKARKDQKDAEDEESGHGITMKSKDFKKLRESFESAYGALEDNKCPGQSWFESKALQVKDGLFKAEKMTECPTVEDDEEKEGNGEIQPVFDPKTRAVVFSSKTKGTSRAPSNYE